MNILVFNENAWDNKNSFGNTLSNWLEGDVWKDDVFLNFYTRFQIPENHLRVSYYRLTPVDIVKGILRGRITGLEFQTSDIAQMRNAMKASAQTEKNRIDRFHTGHSQLVYLAHELLWMSGVWRNRQFKRFVETNCPDILIAFAGGPAILWPLVRYLKKHTHCKIVLFVSDDFYGEYAKLPIYRSWYLTKTLKQAILEADGLYAVSDEMSRLYEKRFGKPTQTLYKGCDLSVEPKQYLNQPLRFVYAGNLLWGRDDTLAAVAEALEQVNVGGTKATLEIYTAATVTDALRRKLQRPGTSQIMDPRPYDEIKGILHGCDVVLHVESFDEKTIETVKYSFSTKIIDCLQSGNQVLGIGPAGIASIEYLRKIPGAAVVDTRDQIQNAIEEMIEYREKIPENARKIRAFARENHEINSVRKKLRQDFLTLTGGTP